MCKTNGCPACGAKINQKEVKMASVYECGKCGAIYGSMYLGDSYTYVLPYFHKGESKPENQRYYDFECLGSEGITRRHGWFDVTTKMITQVG